MNIEINIPKDHWELVVAALNSEINRLEARAKMTRASGYGKATTLDKADQMETRASLLRDFIYKGEGLC